MARSNRECNYCGTPYYVCRSCVDKNSWKNVCCSVECFQKLFEPKDEINKNDKDENIIEEEKVLKPIQNIWGEIDMFGLLLKNKERIKINGFDLELGKFDCEDNTTKNSDEFEEFIINYEELKDISNIKNGDNLNKTGTI